VRLLASTCLLAFFSCLAAAQDTRGSISGTITDSQAAVVAGASVLVTNVDTGTVTRLTSNRSGYYEAPLLLPGGYSVTVELAGFKKSVRTGINLALSEQLQINVQLEVGGTTESLTVSAEAPLLDTSTVSTGRALSNREVMDLPVIGNNISMLTRLAPGVQSPGTTQFLVQGQVGGGSDYRMPGGVGGNEWTLDGASTNGTDRRTSYMPSPDVIDEFKIETSNFDASFGHSTGLSISMSTKSGANAIHGSATEQYFNSRWNAVAFFTKQARYQQIAAARGAGNAALANELEGRPMVPPGHTHQFAGTISGPIYIPKLLDGRNRLFFFLGYSGLRNLQSARPSEINYTVPTLAMRDGDYSKMLQINPNPNRYIVYDPLTVVVDPARAGHWVRTPFAGNLVPKSRFNNPIYSFYAQRMPLPNNDPSDPTKEPVNNFNASSMPNNAFNDSFNNRIDYQASAKHRFFVRWVRSNYLEDAQDYTFGSEPGLMAWNEKRNTRSGAVDWTYAMNATTILNASVDMNQFSLQNQRLGTRKYKPTDAGLPAYMDAKCSGSCVLPRVTWPGMTAWSGDMVLGVAVDAGPTGRQQSAKVNLTHIRDKHSLRAGIDFRQHYRTLLQNGGLTSGAFNFGNNFVRRDDDGNTAAGSLGLVWASFQLGIPTSMSTETNDTYALMNPYYAWYAQDTWRITRSLTVTLGLRMEYEVGPTERYNRALSYFDPNLVLPISEAAQAAYARNPLPELAASQFIVKGGSVYTGRNGVSRQFWRNELMWLPRFSATYQLNNKTVVRGGYGTYFDTLNVMNSSADQTGFSRTTNTQLTNDAGVTWLAGNPNAGISPLADPFPVRANGTRYDTPLQTALGAMARVGQGFSYNDFNRSHSRVQRWRAGVQRELTGNMVVEASYWGQWADRLAVGQKLDFLPEQYWAKGNVRNNTLATALGANVTNPFYIGNFASIQTSDPVLYQQMSTLAQFTSTTIAKNRLLRPFPHMNGLNVNTSPIGKARTHALELNFNRRFARGFQVNGSYTRMFQEDQTTIENEFEQAPRIWYATNAARPHRITATGIYEFPFGKGRRFLQSGVANHVLGGWQVAATYEFQPGPLLGWGNLFYYGNADTFGKDASNVDRSLDQWINTNLQFERNANNTPANFHVRVFPRSFNELRADGLKQWNANLVRNFRIWESVKLQLRADVMNLQNRSQFAAPDLSPTSSTFGKVQAQTSSLNRFYQIQARITF
jgi:hypothetical protein